MKKLMFGLLDLPAGGKLPPAPTFRLYGVERQCDWLDCTPFDYPTDRKLYISYTQPRMCVFAATPEGRRLYSCPQ